MNPITSIFNAVRGAGSRNAGPATSGGAGVSPFSGQPMHGASAESAANLTRAERVEMTTVIVEKVPDPNFPSTMPNWGGEFIDLANITPLVMERHGPIFVTDEIVKIVLGQEKYEMFTDLVSRLSVASVKSQFLEQRVEVVKLAVEGDSVAIRKLLSMDVFTKEEIQVELQEKRHLVKKERKKLCEEVLKITIPAAERLAETCAKYEAEIETEERARASKYGVAFKPSLVLQGISQLRWRPLKHLRDCAWTSPANQAGVFGIEIDSPGLRELKKRRAEAEENAKQGKRAMEKQTKALNDQKDEKAREDREKRLQEWKDFVIQKAKGDLEAMGDRASEELKKIAAGDFSSREWQRVVENFK